MTARLSPLNLLPCAAALAVLSGGAQAAAFSYDLPPGTSLSYQTTIRILVSGGQETSQSLRFATQYTVLDEKSGTRNIFGSANIGEPGSTESVKTVPAGRFTIQLDADGSMGDRIAGLAPRSVPGWTPRLSFPVLAGDGSTTVSIDPPIGQESIAATVRKMSSANGITLDYSHKTDAGQAKQGISINSYEGHAELDSAGKTAAKTSSTLVATLNRGEEMPVTRIVIQSENSLAGRTLLNPAELENLRKDVTAGIAVFANASGGADADTMAAITKYLEQFPAGQFSDIFGMIRDQAGVSKELEANFAKIKEGAKAPGFSARTITGETVRLEDLRGKVVLLDFWATWCGPCVAMVPEVKELYARNRDKGFVILGISSDHDLETLQRFVKSKGMEWKQVYEAGDPKPGSIRHLYGVMKYPTTVLLDREGTIRLVDARGDDLAKAVEELVREK